jgi:uracil-DNA glycosylase family 4
MRELFPTNTFVSPKMPANGKDLVRLVVGEAPGQDEKEAGQPFVGGSGRVLKKLMDRAGIEWDGLTICNTINCQPPNNDYPTDPNARAYISKEDGRQAVRHCIHAHVVPLIESRAWQRIDLIGAKALEFIGLKQGISTWRGSPLTIDTDEIKKA